MPTKKAENGQQYEVSGKKFTWHPLDDNDEQGNLPDIVLPLRIKVKVLRQVAGANIDAESAITVLDLLVPTQTEVVDEMDTNDLLTMFSTYMLEYEKLSGATLGE